jgi:hypothetical protein
VSKSKEDVALSEAVKYLRDRLIPLLKNPNQAPDTRRASLIRMAGVDLENDESGAPPRVEYTGRTASSVIALALSGDRIAHQALCIIAESITARGKTLPLPLQHYVVRAASALKMGKRGNPAINDLRDDAIMWTVQIVISLGLKPTRNSATELPSACSIVAAALDRAGAPAIGERAVEKAWRKRLQLTKDAGFELDSSGLCLVALSDPKATT